MNKITRLSLAKIRKNKKESLLLCILIMICTILLSSSVSALAGIRKITGLMKESTGCYGNDVLISQDLYKNDYLSFLQDNPDVISYGHVSALSSDLIKLRKEGDETPGKLFSISFVTLSSEEMIEIFSPDTQEIFASAEHPIYLDSSNRNSEGICEGDTIILADDDHEYEFTVAGFYDSGIWPLGTKAVISDNDYTYLEQYLNRYEVIGVDLKDGTDSDGFFRQFKEFCQDLNLNDLTYGFIVLTYEQTEQNNILNMSILSIIVAIMAGITVLSVMVMIRHRIVGDIKDQIVSIGVLEALGYTSSEISLSYVTEYLLIALAGVIAGLIPGILFTRFLLGTAASSIHYGGINNVPMIPFIIAIICILLFVALVSLSKALSVRKYPPVKAFRKGIGTHHFKRSLIDLEKAKGSIHVNLALKGFADNIKENIGLCLCVTVTTVTVVLSFMISSFLGNSDTLMNCVCGHEAPDIRIETTGALPMRDLADDLLSMPEVSKVNLVATDEAIRFQGSDLSILLEVYADYDATTSIVLTEGRLPLHDNEIAFTTQVRAFANTNIIIGDTVSIEYGKVKRDYVVTGFVNAVYNASTGYMTDSGFKRINPAYTPDAIDIYLSEGTDEEAFTDLLTSRYGRDLADTGNGEITGSTLEERIRSAAEIDMAQAMIENGVSYMEYSIEVDGQIISGSTNTMKIESLTHVRNETEEIFSQTSLIFKAISSVLMAVAAVVVMIILSILMETTIRKQYRELGIMKGMGYTSKELMFQMAFRMIPAVLTAVVLGTVLGFLLLRVVEIYIARITVSLISVIAVDVAILLFCFVCAYGSARKIKKISVYELMTE